MPVVSAFLVPGSPLPCLQKENPPWKILADAMAVAGQALAASEPDTIVIYSNQWMAVLDQLWQAREHIQGQHVDHNWHEFGELEFDIRVDTDYAQNVIKATNDNGIKAKGVDYDQFPIDTGTIVASIFLNPDGKYPVLISSNNVYHDWEKTVLLGRIATEQANNLNRKIAVIGVGGMSGSFYRHSISISEDKLASDAEDKLNRKMLGLIEAGNSKELNEFVPGFVQDARAEMGFKQLAFLMGAMGEHYAGASVLAYGPIYGTGAAVIEFNLNA